MNKYKLVFILLCILSISSCEKKTLYITPEISGYIYNNTTKEPLKNASGYINFFIPDKNTPQIKLNSNGSFTIPPLTDHYYFIRPNVRKYTNYDPQIYIYFKNYQGKIFDYSNFSWKQIPSESRGYSHFKKIDLGIIYLDPEKP